MSSRRLPHYTTPAGWIASIISEALPPGGDGRGGRKGRLNL